MYIETILNLHITLLAKEEGKKDEGKKMRKRKRKKRKKDRKIIIFPSVSLLKASFGCGD